MTRTDIINIVLTTALVACGIKVIRRDTAKIDSLEESIKSLRETTVFLAREIDKREVSHARVERAYRVAAENPVPVEHHFTERTVEVRPLSTKTVQSSPVVHYGVTYPTPVYTSSPQRTYATPRPTAYGTLRIQPNPFAVPVYRTNPCYCTPTTKPMTPQPDPRYSPKPPPTTFISTTPDC